MQIAAFYENVFQGALAEKISVADALKSLKQAGLEALYIGNWGIAIAKKLGIEEDIFELCRELGLRIEGLHHSVDLAHDPNDESWREAIDLAVKYGATNVLIVPGQIAEGDDREKVLENIVSGLKKAVKYGEECGVAVSMEDFDGLAAPYCTIDGLNYFMQNVPGLKCSFDTGNFVMYSEDEMAAFEVFRDKICTMHLKDRSRTQINEGDHPVTLANGEQLWPVAVGGGCMRIAEMIAALKAQGYDGGLIAEIFGCSGEKMLESIKKSIEWIAKVAK